MCRPLQSPACYHPPESNGYSTPETRHDTYGAAVHAGTPVQGNDCGTERHGVSTNDLRRLHDDAASSNSSNPGCTATGDGGMDVPFAAGCHSLTDSGLLRRRAAATVSVAWRTARVTRHMLMETTAARFGEAQRDHEHDHTHLEPGEHLRTRQRLGQVSPGRGVNVHGREPRDHGPGQRVGCLVDAR